MSDYDVGEDDDGLDGLFGYDIDQIKTTYEGAGDDAQPVAGSSNTKTHKANANDGELGVDEEIKIRKRKPAVKLTEERLLSPEGIPYLQKHAANSIKFKGKGHEISDLERLLNFYQIWADSLYPKAQFKDAIDMIERLGSTRSMHRKREEWVEQFKAEKSNEDERLIKKARAVLSADEGEKDAKGRIILRIPDPANQTVETSPRSGSAPQIGVPQKDNGDSLFFEDDDEDGLDELDELIREAEKAQAVRPESNGPSASQNLDDDMDDLDTIMKEIEDDATSRTKLPSVNSQARRPVDSDDEFEEAMAAMRETEKYPTAN